MEHTFEKESILIEWVPMTLMIALSLMGVIFVATFDKVSMIIGSVFITGFFGVWPIMYFRYFQSFSSVSINKNAIKVFQKNAINEFTIPDDVHRLHISYDDLKIELKKNGHRFVVRTHFLKNKSEFHKLFDRMLKDYPPPEDKINLKGSLIEMMEDLK